ncbi:BREX-1 system adenine-specific DNA-methyltransferase PglX [Priestia megaterium]|uniref:BREX-1 system adenine-specific DNA-methyltransferase PglX n=1 Tax=Priestia megaterium TaxID=1404 RepID=UPI002E1C703A|nr:BREX-1 system adenine-specific DNA-methyltransferase PglX [Priestia megaterium]
MNKTELKNFAVFARRDLLEKVALRAKIFGIDEKNSLTIDEQFGQLVINGNIYPLQMKTAFQSLASQLKTKGYEQLIEEVAYTWFNRIIAIRYMEVNEYLPERVNVLSSNTGKIEPDILSQFETMDLNIDVATIKDLIRQGETEDSYRKLFIAQCNSLNSILPFMFEKIQDYTELLLPDFLLDSESVINTLVSNEALTKSFTEVEVIGWLYQFYNSEPKDKVFANLKKNRKIEKYDIPAATQLFTPKWIVQYMVENSLGQLWLESNPDSFLKESMSYYIEPVEQEEKMKQKLEQIQYKNVNLEEIRIIDPCVGSGHILVYTFDLLYQMYEEAGYPSGDIPQLILEKNLFGLDIDDRAAQLASFALIMKAREKSRRIFRKQIQLNVFAIQDSNLLDKKGISMLLGQNEKEKEEMFSIIETFINAKNFGSIIVPPELDYIKYLNRIERLEEEQLSVETYQAYEQLPEVQHLLKQAMLLGSKYDIALTNPPYMGAKGFNKILNDYVKNHYPTSKYDLYAVFIERLFIFLKENGFNATINQHSWMFLGSYEKLRRNIINNSTIYSMVHLGPRAFEDIGGEVVQSTSYIARNAIFHDYSAVYIRLVDQTNASLKESSFFNHNLRFIYQQKDFQSIPNSPLAYWASEKIRKIFKEYPKFGEIAEPRVGMQTSDNNRFLRLWHEVPIHNVGFKMSSIEEAVNSRKKWFPFNKGGNFRKWYGNNEYVVNYENNGKELKELAEELNKQSPGGRIKNQKYYFKEGITWSKISGGKLSVRYSEKGFIFSDAGMKLFAKREDLYYFLALLNSSITEKMIKQLSSTLNFEQGNIARIPVVKTNEIVEKVDFIVRENIEISKQDWNLVETSWDFIRHPLLNFETDSFSTAFNNWMNYKEEQYLSLKSNEEQLNSILIELYSLQDELKFEVLDEDITLRKADLIRDTKSFLSYFIGCVLGRYSLDIDGLAYAGGEWDDSKYITFSPNKFGLIQLTDEHYFEKDIIVRLREFLSVTFGAETVEENLQWIAESLELKRNETAEERLRRYFLDEFFKDHYRLYQKRPIYWLVDSGKQKGLRTLIYMHRYQPDTMATIRFEHLQEIQSKYNNEISAVDLRIVNPNLSATEKRDLEKRKNAYQKRLEELLEFDKKLAEYANAQISIDLDDGVKVNYAKFDKVLAKIK